MYKKKKNGEMRLYLFLPSERYIVVLTERKSAFYLVTAFPIEHTYKLNEYQREFEKHKVDVV